MSFVCIVGLLCCVMIVMVVLFELFDRLNIRLWLFGKLICSFCVLMVWVLFFVLNSERWGDLDVVDWV